MPYHARHFENLPYQAVNRVLSLELLHGTVHLSEKAIQHIRERHPNDYDLCMSCMESVITRPDFIGQEPHHPEAFEMVKQIGSIIMLVAIGVIADEYGDYPVLSSYIIPHNALQRRLRKKHLYRYQ